MKAVYKQRGSNRESMRNPIPRLIHSVNTTMKEPILSMSAWLPSLLVSFLIGGTAYGFLYAGFALCLDVKEVVEFHARPKTIPVATEG